MTIAEQPASPPSVPEPPRPPRLTTCFAVVGAAWLLLALATWGLRHADAGRLTGSGVFQGVAVVVLAAVAAALWEFRRGVLRLATSVPFSVALIGVLLVWTVVGTVIPQQAAPDAYVGRHGRIGAMAIMALGLDDLFHTVWYQGLLAIAAVALVLTAVEKRAWRPSLLGHLLSHLGFVTVLIGGWIGGHYGFKGAIELHEGQAVDRVHVLGRGGAPSEETRPLGFAVKLERFAVENYKPEARFYVYEREGEGYRALRSFDLRQATAGQAVGASGGSFRLAKAYPDFRLVPEIHDAPAGQGAPVLEIDIGPAGRAVHSVLQAGVPGRDSAAIGGDGATIRFAWATPGEAEIAAFALPRPETHVIALRGGDADEEVAVAPGASASLTRGGYDVRLLEYLPDFTYDSAAKRATTRSPEPNNPAVHVVITERASGREQVRWLFANMPDFGHGEGASPGPRFVYRHLPPSHPAPRGLLVLGEAGQVWRLEDGQVVQRRPLEEWQAACVGLPVAAPRLHPAAVVASRAETASEEWRNPMADIVVSEGGKEREVRLAAEHGQPVAMADGRTILVFEVRVDEPKAFRSHLTVLVGGQAVTEKTVVVNDPLTYGGYMFYQSSFRRDDPTYSGIQVVRDPGLGVVFAGLAMMSLGVIWVYYVRPRLLPGVRHGT